MTGSAAWTIRLGGAPPRRISYRLLDLELTADHPLTELAPAPAAGHAVVSAGPWQPRGGRATFAGDVFLAGGRVRLGIWWQGARAWLEVDGVAFGLDLEAGVIELVTPPVAGSERWLEHVLLGPPLLLALAQRGRFALHAGAVDTGAGLLAFVGPSGAGKSTLAVGAGEGWRPFADDLLPVAMSAGRAVGLGGFPQSKLAPERRRLGEGEALPLAAVVVLGQTGAFSLRRLAPAEATAAWVAHTMIARLLSPELLAEHLAWAGAGATATPTWAVTLPRGLDRLGEVRGWLSERLCYPPPR